MLSISINNDELNRFFRNIDKYSQQTIQNVDKEVARASYAIHAKAQQEAPVGKKLQGASISPGGNLKRQIYVKIKQGKASGEVGVNVNYALPVHEGSKPHIIRIRNKKVLAAYLGTNKFKIFGKQVNHPGTKANPFLKRAVDFERPRYIANLKMILNDTK